MKIKKIHEDKRGYIYLVKNLLEDNKEFTFLEIKKGFARGGCLHSNEEYFVVISGKIRYIHGKKEEILSMGQSRKIPSFEPHAFFALEHSIVSEWGVDKSKSENNRKDSKLRAEVDRING